jgi:argininosuccinate synthase
MNLFGRSCEAGVLEDPWDEPPEEAFAWTVDPAKAPNEPVYIEIEFEHGIPIGLEGQRMDGVPLIERLNDIGGKHGVGRIDHVENRLVGIKSREVYEAPAATVLHAAHRALETLVLTRDVMQFKDRVGAEWARLVYDGLWFSSFRVALDAFVHSTQGHVTGDVRMRLEGGTARVAGRRAPQSLYRLDLATYDRAADSFDHSAARGFIELFGLPLRTQTRVQGALEDAAPLPVERRAIRPGNG